MRVRSTQEASVYFPNGGTKYTGSKCISPQWGYKVLRKQVDFSLMGVQNTQEASIYLPDRGTEYTGNKWISPSWGYRVHIKQVDISPMGVSIKQIKIKA